MTRRAVAAFVALVAIAPALTGCQQPSTTIAATGRVLADPVAVQAPSLAVPKISLDAGFPLTPGTSPTTSTVPALLSLGTAQRVSAVEVRLGDRVSAGDVLVRFDDAALAAQVRVAKADAAVAKSQIGVLDAALDSLADKQRDLREKRQEIVDGIAKATKARKELTGKLADARKAAANLPGKLATVEKNLRLLPSLAEVEAKLTQVKAALAALPPETPPQVRDELLQALQKLTAARAAIPKLIAARATLTAAIGQLNKGIPKLAKAIATIDANLARARDGIRKIDQGLNKLADARAGLKRTRKLAVIAAADTTGVEVATLAKGQSVVRAPGDGVVTAVAHVGDVLAPGATVAELARPASVVTTWLSPEQVAQTCLDATASVRLDSSGTAVDGRISRILPLAAYPPSYHATDQTHLTRAVGVEVTVGSALPPGVPADLRLSPCSTSR